MCYFFSFFSFFIWSSSLSYRFPQLSIPWIGVLLTKGDCLAQVRGLQPQPLTFCCRLGLGYSVLIQWCWFGWLDVTAKSLYTPTLCDDWDSPCMMGFTISWGLVWWGESHLYRLIVAGISVNETRWMDTRYIISFDDNEQLNLGIQNTHKVKQRECPHLQRSLVNATRPDRMVS